MPLSLSPPPCPISISRAPAWSHEDLHHILQCEQAGVARWLEEWACVAVWRTRLYLFLHREYFVSLRPKAQRIRGCVSTRLRLQMQHPVPRLSWQAAANHAKWRRPP